MPRAPKAHLLQSCLPEGLQAAVEHRGALEPGRGRARRAGAHRVGVGAHEHEQPVAAGEARLFRHAVRPPPGRPAPERGLHRRSW